MNRIIGTLLLLLALQCGLVLAVFWPSLESQHTPRESLAPLALERVDVIHVGDEFDNETVLSRAGEHWILPELDNLPADAAMVSKLLEAIAAGDGAWPVADSVAARQRSPKCRKRSVSSGRSARGASCRCGRHSAR